MKSEIMWFVIGVAAGWLLMPTVVSTTRNLLGK